MSQRSSGLVVAVVFTLLSAAPGVVSAAAGDAGFHVVADFEGGLPAGFVGFADSWDGSGSTTTLAYALPEPGPVRISVFDVQGRLVKVLVDETRPEGPHTTRWHGVDGSGRQAPSGLYFARLEFGGETATRKMMLVR